MAVLDAKGVMEPYREPRGSRGWFVLVLGVVVFAAFGGVVGYAYLHGLPGIGGEPPLIRAEEGPYRHAPSDRGGLAVANASSSIVSVLRPTNERPRVERLLPPEATVALQPPAPPTAAPLPPPAPLQPPVPVPTPADAAASSPAEPEVPAAEGAPLAVPVPQVRPPAPDQLATREPPSTISALPRAAPPAPEPAPAPATAAPRRLTSAQPAPAPAPATAQRTARVEPAPPAAAAAPRASSSAGTYRLQLAAVRTDNGLNQAWADLRQRYPSALGTVNSQVERTDTTTGPLYRLQAGPYANREAAANACASIKASGGQCFIVGPIAP